MSGDKHIQRLKKSELLEMLLEAERENEALEQENRALNERLSMQNASSADAQDGPQGESSGEPQSEPQAGPQGESSGEPQSEPQAGPQSQGDTKIESHQARPTQQELSQELGRRRRGAQTRRIVRNVLVSLLGVAAATVLAATLFFPTLRIYGSSMTPALQEGEVVVTVAHAQYKTGDIIAFYYNNKLLVKRVICGPGDWFSMAEDGSVYVNGVLLNEPYVQEESFGPCDLEFPYQVPEGSFFVMGDHRSSSVDSRLKQVGCVRDEQIVGRIVLCVWPLASFGGIG